MSEASYRRRLRRDLAKWQAQGFVTPEGAAAIEASLPSERTLFSMSSIIAALGALLFGLGVLALVAANWEAIPRLVRFILLLATIAGAYGAAGTLRERDLPGFAEAALFVAGLVFGASIALIGQSYHLAGDFWDAVLLWTAGCLAASLLARSAAMAILALAGAAYWGVGPVLDEGGVSAWALPLILAGAGLATWLNSRLARLAAILSLGTWIVATLVDTADKADWPLAGAVAAGISVALFLWATGAALTTLRSPRLTALESDLMWPALGAFLFGVVMLQGAVLAGPDSGRGWLLPTGLSVIVATGLAVLARARRGLSDLDVIAVCALGIGCLLSALLLPPETFASRLFGGCLVLLAALWAVTLGQSGRQPGAKPVGLVMFALESIYIYGVTLGSVLDTAFALLLGGVLFIGLSTALFRLDRRLSQRLTGASA